MIVRYIPEDWHERRLVWLIRRSELGLCPAGRPSSGDGVEAVLSESETLY